MITLLFALGCSDRAADTVVPVALLDAVAPPALVINEFLPRNRTTNTDAAGGFEDWIELYNASDAAIDLDAFYLNEYPASTSLQAPLPRRTLASHAFLVVWCVGYGGTDTGTPVVVPQVDLELDGGDGESLSLVWLPAPEAVPVLVETWTYGVIPTDLSVARLPDGGPNWLQAKPTPGETNGEAP